MIVVAAKEQEKILKYRDLAREFLRGYEIHMLKLTLTINYNGSFINITLEKA